MRSCSRIFSVSTVSKQTASDYLKNKEMTLKAVEKVSAVKQKNLRDGSHPKQKEALNILLRATLARKVPVSRDMLKQKAVTLTLHKDITDCKFNDGWLCNFKKRYDLAFKRMCGESGAVDITLVANYHDDELCSLLCQ